MSKSINEIKELWKQYDNEKLIDGKDNAKDVYNDYLHVFRKEILKIREETYDEYFGECKEEIEEIIEIRMNDKFLNFQDIERYLKYLRN